MLLLMAFIVICQYGNITHHSQAYVLFSLSRKINQSCFWLQLFSILTYKACRAHVLRNAQVNNIQAGKGLGLVQSTLSLLQMSQTLVVCMLDYIMA
uniref:Uncharacterized protein n=1 Tax=Arundo donax TaxID=35708 RepID=A0A0A9BZP9_ARUDO